MLMIFPDLIAHADWGTNPRKQWLVRAELQPTGRYLAHAPELVGQADTLIARLRERAGRTGCLWLGFDFPIGLPLAYAEKVGVADFLALLPQLGQGQWVDFYRVAERPAEIHLHRPFYPQRPGGTRQQQLLAGLGVTSLDDLRRRCDLPRPPRRAAAPLFWTLGGQQVGKAAINGWQTVLAPAMRDEEIPLVIWPFSGPLFELFQPGQVVVAETYPAECYTHLGVTFSPGRPGQKSGKRVQAERQANAATLLAWAAEAGVGLDPALRAALAAGFGSGTDGEDRFDAVIGLFGMLNVALGHRPPGGPEAERVRRLEGWILGLDNRA